MIQQKLGRSFIKSISVAVLLLTLTVVGATASTGGAYLLDWWTVDGGGATTSTGGDYALGGTAGQPDASVAAATGGDYVLRGGFWHSAAPDAGPQEYFLPIIFNPSPSQ